MFIRGFVLSIMTQLLLNWSHYILVDGCQSNLVNMVSGVLQGCVLGSVVFLHTSEFFCIFQDMLFVYTHDYTLIAGSYQ